MQPTFIAHRRAHDQAEQSVKAHLAGVAVLAERFASKVNLGLAGNIIGLVHDLGKYSNEFQTYFKSATGLINPDDDEWIDAGEKKGKVDHSTAGSQLIWNSLNGRDRMSRLVAQALSLCVASHHSGLIDCLTIDGEDNFSRRISKSSEKTHISEVENTADSDLLAEIHARLSDPQLVRSVREELHAIMKKDHHGTGDPMKDTVIAFKLGLMVRFLFSCLIDADRIDTADFENPKGSQHRQFGAYPKWEVLIDRLESHLASFGAVTIVDQIRRKVSQACFDRAGSMKGLFTLTVPTGGGKTLASLRFALHHARHHGMERIIYVIPFTSIIDQNARVVREILEDSANDEFGSIVLEQHSNVSPEHQTWKAKILSENWDAPVIFTTSVQFLECLFGSGTREVRRMHQLANAVVVFDEIQTLPVRCVHMFCNALNYLVDRCGTSAVLCTATQPLLDNLSDKSKGYLELRKDRELMSEVAALFQELKRVDILDRTKPGGWSDIELAELAIQEMDKSGSCLVIVNTKAAAKAVYQSCRELTGESVFHLSTSMCPAHRMAVLDAVRAKLGNSRLICISTQLIEAGVDIDFGTVIRFAAGMDSIAQAAGRCNRNGKAASGRTYIVNPKSESIDSLEDIKIGKEKTARVLSEFAQDPGSLGNDLLSPEVMERYFLYYFYDRANDMDYPVSPKEIERDDTLLRLLSTNNLSPGMINFENSGPALRQSFHTAAKAFQAIDAPTQGVIVPYGEEGRQLVGELTAAFDVEKHFELLRRAQRYTVNVFPNVMKQLHRATAVGEVQPDSGLLYLSERYYSDEFGLSLESVSELEPLII